MFFKTNIFIYKQFLLQFMINQSLLDVYLRFLILAQLFFCTRYVTEGAMLYLSDTYYFAEIRRIIKRIKMLNEVSIGNLLFMEVCKGLQMYKQ